MAIDEVQSRLTQILWDYHTSHIQTDYEELAKAIIEQLPIKMVECPNCGNQDIVTERQCYQCNKFWTED